MRAGNVVRIMRWSKSHRERTETKESVEFAVIEEKHAANGVQALNVRVAILLLMTVRGVAIENTSHGLRTNTT
jgi:hypothetical protein